MKNSTIAVTKKLIRVWLPRRQKDAHKGSVGRIYIIAGSRGMAGAAVLAAWGSVRGGAGLTKVATGKSQYRVLAMRGPLETTIDELPESKNGHISASSYRVIRKSIFHYNPTIIGIGPGLGIGKTQQKVLRYLWNSPFPLVIDADGLNNLALMKLEKRTAPVILTPHPGEMARLMKTTSKMVQHNRISSIVKATRKFRGICLLKGHETLISNSKSIYKNHSGVSAMASGGMGDLLTGLICALWGQMKSINLETGMKAAVLAAYIHGKAGEKLWKKEGGLSVLASDVARKIPLIIKNLKSSN